MGVDIVDLFGIDACIPERVLHAAGGAFTPGRRLGHVISVGAHAISHQLGIDGRPSASGMFQLLEHQNTGAIAEYKAVTIPIPGPTRQFGFVIAPG